MLNGAFYFISRVNLLLLGFVVSLLFCLTETAFATEGGGGLPGILRYAQEQKMKQGGGDKQPQIVEPERTYVGSGELKHRLTRSETEVRQLRRVNHELREQLKKASALDNNKEVVALKKQLQEQADAYKRSISELTEKAESARNKFAEEIVLLKQKLSAQEWTDKEKASNNSQKLAETLAKLESTVKENGGLKNSIDELKAKMEQMPVVNTEELSVSEKQQAYAAGVMIGRDILSLQATNALSGIKTDNRILLAGIWDALSHKELLNENLLQTALEKAEKSIQKARLETAAKWKKAGSTWLETFKKQNGVQQDQSGFWYRVDYSGDGDLINGEETIVDVVVVEKLTDGTVIEDMDAQGTVISQPLGEYPALFRSALLLLKNHGTVTVAAPAELAYGDEGYPPKVPPGATMVYTIRVENVKMKNASSDNLKNKDMVSSKKTKRGGGL